jgi:hypothetical protein
MSIVQKTTGFIAGVIFTAIGAGLITIVSNLGYFNSLTSIVLGFVTAVFGLVIMLNSLKGK